jgi:uncharacterized peroxidase-related enzyme
MQRIESVDPRSATGHTRELFDTVQSAFGTIPSVARVLGNSPAALAAFLGFAGAMDKAAIGARLATQIKLAASEKNGCTYCTSILTSLGRSKGITAADLTAARAGSAADQREQAALAFAAAVLDTRGKVSAADLHALRQHGFGDAEIVEIVASVVLACFTNFVNNVADTSLDIPRVEPLISAAGR